MTKIKNQTICVKHSSTDKMQAVNYALACESSLTDYQFLTLLQRGGVLWKTVKRNLWASH